MAKKKPAASIFDPENDPAPDVFAVKWSEDGQSVKVTHYPDRQARKACCSVSGSITEEDKKNPNGQEVGCLTRLRMPCGYQD